MDPYSNYYDDEFNEKVENIKNLLKYKLSNKSLDELYEFCDKEYYIYQPFKDKKDELIEEKRKKEYNLLKDKYNDLLEKINIKINENRQHYLEGDIDEIKRQIDNVLFLFLEKYNLSHQYEINYDYKSKTLFMNYVYDKLENFPYYTEYIESEITNIEEKVKLKESCFIKKYEDFISKLTLRIIQAIYTLPKVIENIIFNGYTNMINKSNGVFEKRLVLTTEINKNEFENINLSKVDAVECLNSFKIKKVKNILNPELIEPINKLDKETFIKSALIQEIDYNIDGFQFEVLSKDLLLANGFYNVEVTKFSGDYGADVIAYKDDIKYAIQCKKYSKAVGVKAIQEVMGSKSVYKCHVAAVLTNNIFTSQAQKLAKENGVLLWDRNKLLEFINNMKENEFKNGKN